MRECKEALKQSVYLEPSKPPILKLMRAALKQSVYLESS